MPLSGYKIYLCIKHRQGLQPDNNDTQIPTFHYTLDTLWHAIHSCHDMSFLAHHFSRTHASMTHIISILFYFMLCPLAAGGSRLPDSSNYLCLLLSLSMLFYTYPSVSSLLWCFYLLLDLSPLYLALCSRMVNTISWFNGYLSWHSISCDTTLISHNIHSTSCDTYLI